ncbi:MAG: PVC-type heme-binding CxxCH protein, partial [Planctomyces sp.]
YTYSGGPYEKKLRDRIVILEDKDGDGRHDSRKVFWDQGFMLTSLTWGFGGLWILHDGTLSFIPDRNGDDIPDSEPVVQLDGWSKDCGHNFVSGLIWGPDGWLYGRHGIVDTSRPGIPGTPTQDRPVMNCGIWRYHPVTRQIEVVCHGTTNPWGLDYNEDCQFFMTNNVQGHLWHIIPGARFQRMYGQDFNPFSFELMEMTADHYHWDTKMKWTDSRDGKANDLGGGHSHVGALIYHGDQFPKEYRGKIFMCNTHGRRINVNRLDREGSGYVGRSEPDFMLVKNPWFRGVDIKMGPEGSMYVADWSDNGECHDHDGIHRTSGRIYRISYGDGKTNAAAAINALKDPSAHRSRSDWAGRHARRILQERAAAGERVDDSPSFTPLSSVQAFLFHAAIGRLTQKNIMDALKSQDEVLRAQAVQLAANTASADAAQRTSLLSAIRSMASQPQSASVLMALMSV